MLGTNLTFKKIISGTAAQSSGAKEAGGEVSYEVSVFYTFILGTFQQVTLCFVKNCNLLIFLGHADGRKSFRKICGPGKEHT